MAIKIILYGTKIFDELNKCSMSINLSRGSPIKHYSVINFVFTRKWLINFYSQDYNYEDFLNKNEVVFYKNINDLNNKIIYYKKNPSKLKDIARNGYYKSHKIFNNKIISDYIVRKSMNLKISNKLKWMDA